MNVTAKDLRRAAEIKDEIDSLEKELKKILGGSIASSGRASAAQGKRDSGMKTVRRKMSAAGRAKIAAAAKRRWAEAKKAGKNSL